MSRNRGRDEGNGDGGGRSHSQIRGRSRRSAPDSRPVVLTIAGSDSGGGAGIQADLKTIEACGGFGTSAITSVTAQHTRGVESAHLLPAAEIEAQIEAVTGDLDVRAIKTGMLATAEVVELVADVIHEYDDGGDVESKLPVVIDPVMVAASGDRLLEPEGEAAYEHLITEATVVTPNADEAAVLTDVDVTDLDSALEAGEDLLEGGADAALIKGGHVDTDPVRDVLVTPDGHREFTHPRIDDAATHGSGCTLASAIATQLAHGNSLEMAVEVATDLLQRAIRYYQDVGRGPGSVHHLASIREEAARTSTVAAVESVVERLQAADVGDEDAQIAQLVPEVGMQIVGATPYAERPAEVAAVDGRITRTAGGIRPNRGVGFGASSHVARLVLAAREFDAGIRFGANCRYDDAVASALDSLEWPVATFDRTEEPDPDIEGGTMEWGIQQAFEKADQPPVAIVDDGAVGKEAMTRILARNGARLGERMLSLARALA